MGLPAEARAKARLALLVPVISVGRGDWTPPELHGAAMGVMILDGLMVRSIQLGPASSAELIGPGDMLRPWEEGPLPSLTSYPTAWKVLDEASMALLDERVTVRLSLWPQVFAALAGRFLRRSRCLAYLMAAQHCRRVEDRLLFTLWHVASMWGRVTPRGIRLPIRLTHEMLAQIVGVRRPTISVALRTLALEGRLTRDEARQIVLLGDPPDWFQILGPPSEPEHENDFEVPTTTPRAAVGH